MFIALIGAPGRESLSGGQFCWPRCVSVSRAGEGARPQGTGTPAASATACRWRAWLSHLLFPRNQRVYRREGEGGNKETAQLPTSLPRLHRAQHCCCARTSFAQKSRRVPDVLSRCRSLFVSVSERTCFRHATTLRRRRSHICDVCCQEQGEVRVRWEREAGMYKSRCNLRRRGGLQVHAGSICALLTHLKNKSHMGNDWNLF